MVIRQLTGVAGSERDVVRTEFFGTVTSGQPSGCVPELTLDFSGEIILRLKMFKFYN